MENVVAAFSEDQTVRLTGVRKGQLRYWDTTQFFSPSFAQDDSDIFGRIYSYKDIVALKVLGLLRNKYDVSVQHLRDVKENLLQEGKDPWSGVRLYVVNKRVHWVEPNTGLPQNIASKQYLLSKIDLDAVVGSVKSAISDIIKRDPRKVGQVEKVRSLNKSQPIIGGTRITVESIKRFHSAGFTIEQILLEYPDLKAADVRAALDFEKAA